MSILIIFGIHVDIPNKCLSQIMRSTAEVAAMVNRFYPSDDDSKKRYQDATLPTVSFLPQEYVFANGTAITIRNARKDEVQPNNNQLPITEYA